MAVYRNIVTGSIVSVADDYKLDANWEPFVDEVEVPPPRRRNPKTPQRTPPRKPPRRQRVSNTGGAQWL